MSEKSNTSKDNLNLNWLFPSDIDEAKEIQLQMAQKVILEDQLPSKLQYLAGMDSSNNLFDPTNHIYAASVLLDYPSLNLIEMQSQPYEQTFPYITGLLGFREAPALVEAFYKLKQTPDLIMVDGHGISHPRGLGIASQLGVLLNIPTIGVAKSLLVGRPFGELGTEIGDTCPLMYKGKEIAKLVRTKKKVLPLIVSTGNRVSLATAVELVLKCLKGNKLPEPTKQAHLAANQCRTSHLSPFVT